MRLATASCLCVALHSVIAAENPACPVTLVEIGPVTKDGEASEGLRLLDAGVQYLAKLQSPIYLVPMLGQYRGGKSLLMNRLMGLSAPYGHGFGVGHSQDTFTRGINVCAEPVTSLGTVVWMDTEGLFSSEEARSAYGPKIFSLALLFSSVVMLNSQKVLSDQFFAFFGEQQQLARVLKEGLAKEGLLSEGSKNGLLAGNLSIFWILQQPISAGYSTDQLQKFLDVPDDTRQRVRSSFHHEMHEVPVASYDVRKHGVLDTVPDSELVADYLSAVKQLRERILTELGAARPMQAASVTKQLEMFVHLVQTEQFSVTLVKEAFEQNEIVSLCDSFRQKAKELAGPLPSNSLAEAFSEARSGLEERRKEVIEQFHFGAEWSKRFNACIKDQSAEIEKRNAELVLETWQILANKVSENASCFFLGGLALQLKEYGTTYGPAFNDDLKARAMEHASNLQRQKLVECVRLADFLWPLLPWLAWPLGGFYLQRGLLSGFVSMGMHAVIVAGVYSVLQFLGRLPGYLDVDYKVLKNHRALLDFVMRLPPTVPWHSIAGLCGITGLFYSGYKMLRIIVRNRPPGAEHAVGQMANLELKLNILRKRSEASIKHDIAAAAFSATTCLENGDARGAAMALVQGLSLVRNIDGQDYELASIADAQMQRHVHSLLSNCQLPKPTGKQKSAEILRDDRGRFGKHDLVERVARGDFEEVLQEMLRLLQLLTTSSSAASTPAASPAASPPAVSPAALTPPRSAGRADQLGPRNLDQTLGAVGTSDASLLSPSPALSQSDVLSPSPAKSRGTPENEPESEEEEEDVMEEASSGLSSRRLLLFGAGAVCVTAWVGAQLLPNGE